MTQPRVRSRALPLENDRIVELWETWDEGGLLGKLGVAPGACGA